MSQEPEAICEDRQSDQDDRVALSSMSRAHEKDAIPLIEGLLPAFTAFMTLEEMGVLYLFSLCGNLNREAAKRLTRLRGVPEAEARDIIDFYFARIATKDAEVSMAALQAPSESDLPKPQKRLTIEQTMRLGDDEEEVLTVPVKGGKALSIRADFVNEYKGTFTLIDVAQEMRRASHWLEANPAKQKTPRGMRRFINGWLQRANERKEIARMQTGASSSNGFGAEVPSGSLNHLSDGEAGDGFEFE